MYCHNTRCNWVFTLLKQNVNVLQDQIEEDQARILGLEDKVRKLVEMVKSERRLREELASQQSPVSSAQTNANALALKQAQKEVEELQNQAITMEGIITEFKVGNVPGIVQDLMDNQ